MAERDLDELGEEGSLVLEQRFAIVPEWIIDARISDCASRLYSILLRYGQSSGQRMPGRATLAARLQKSSKDTVDRALKELVRAGAVVVEHRCRDGRNLTNRYHVMSTPPAARRVSAGDDGRISAATRRSSRNGAARPNSSYREPSPHPSGLRASRRAGEGCPTDAR